MDRETQWRTALTMNTDDSGTAKWRGFPGWYEVRLGNDSRLVWLGKSNRTTSIRFSLER